MFSYYGSKSKIVDMYPTPKFDKIIEPFAGSARYSLRFWQKDILLVDKYQMIVDVWHYLQNASPNDILKLPQINTGDNILNYNLSKDEFNFVILLLQQGTIGGTKAYEWGVKNYKQSLERISRNLFKIKHWTIKQGDYIDIENQNATWFVDAPYEFGGHKYKHSNKHIDFMQLKNFCNTRNGQVIVCENTKATWMSFKPLKQMQGIKFKTIEAIWSNQPTNYDYQVLSLF